MRKMRVINLKVDDLIVNDAIEYTKNPAFKRIKQPDISFNNPNGLNNILKITDRYVLLDFLRALHPEEDIQYLDMMYTIYDCDDEEKPSFHHFIGSYVYNSSVTEISVHVDEVDYESEGINTQTIRGISLDQTKSQYIDECNITISNVIADACEARWVESISYVNLRKKASVWRHPCLTYTDGDKSIEVLSAHQRTYFVCRYRVGEGWVQPMNHVTKKKWAHMIDVDELVSILQPMIDKLKELDTKPKVSRNKYGDRAMRLNFNDKNKLEREDYFFSFGRQ